MRHGRRPKGSQGGGRDIDADRGYREIFGNGSDRSFGLYKDIGNCLAVFFILFPLQPRSTELAKFLVMS